ncbi:ABC transporter ATP-binding protein [Bombiscardovia apis]|uniref:ABC transporter ATP-binding protein n=1 Tax=Bombiscardovia apis TaxID=2932182 RepID=A0ABN6SGQ3_9BIFI|nr:ABC transporter ATP-binding protein [Bombiscardovia apis]BDR54673.1 ABC transporter ATP-binding protein [Bombiscardovia apis]
MFVSVENLSKSIKSKKVLEEVNLSCEQGKVYGLVGPNGSGKTMLLRALCGFIRPDSGTIVVNDKPVEFNKGLPTKTGIIIETPGFIGNQSAMWNLEYLAGLDNGWDPKETLRLMSQFGLYEHRDEKVKSYSLGMRQKLAIVQALMEKQKLVLLDEPTNGLDKASVETFLGEMEHQKEQGTTIVIASHHDDEIMQVADSVFTIENGHIYTDSKRLENAR